MIVNHMADAPTKKKKMGTQNLYSRKKMFHAIFFLLSENRNRDEYNVLLLFLIQM